MAQAKKTNNQLQKRPSFPAFIKSDKVKAELVKTLGTKAKADTFTTAVVSAVNNNPQLQECEFNTIMTCALMGETLKLSPSTTIGQYYMVPFKDKEKGKVAQFILSYKGYLQLAIRSGQYRKIQAVEIKEGELEGYDPIMEEATFSPITDPLAREKAKTIGYYGQIELTNGFKKSIYWSKEKMNAHAEKYSMGYKAHKGYTFWEKEFDEMAKKTIIRQLISKWGVMSIDMMNGYEADGGFRTSREEPIEYGSSDNAAAGRDVVEADFIEDTGEVVNAEVVEEAVANEPDWM